MKKISTLLLSLFSLLAHAQIITGSRPADFEYFSAPDSLGHRQALEMPGQNRTTPLLPYPIIFVHGLNSSSDTWNTAKNFMNAYYGTSYGGRIDYCLNADANLATANCYGTSEIVVFGSTLTSADYYFVNFDVGTNGGVHPSGGIYDVLSNQSAITKQGLALMDAIGKVLQITGRDKVVLMGHSMGGLAAREYLQNPNIWQPDGEHHVAKLVTTGTPHLGSNQVTGGALSGVDCQSEAYRDLRTSYSGSGSPGVYLFGGTESNAVMDLSFCSNFYNVNVNCNATVGDNVVGLNQKNTPPNVDYSCIIGECAGCGGSTNTGDGIVTDYSANINNVFSGLANLYYYYGSGTVEIHTDLPLQNAQNMAGLDEPDKISVAYTIELGTTYIGMLTAKANVTVDRDEYKVYIPTNGYLNMAVGGIVINSDFTVNLLNSSLQLVGSGFHPAGSLQSINFTKQVSQGWYYFEIVAPPVNYLNRYDFILSFSPCTIPSVDFSYVTNASNISFSNLSQNAQSYWWNFGDGVTSAQTNPNHTYLADGSYTVSLTASNGCGSLATSKIVTISTCQAVIPSFIHSNEGLAVQFTNTSINGSVSVWDFGDGTGSTSTSPTHTFSSPGAYDISLTETNQCSSQTAFEQIFVGPTGIGEIEQGIKLYPNPTNGNLTIMGEAGDIEIYNSVGQLVLSFTALEGSLRQIDISSLSSGFYCLRTNFGISSIQKL